MARIPRPWLWKSKRIWVVNIQRKRYYLGSDKEAAHQKYHELMARVGNSPTIPKKKHSLAWLLDKFIHWNRKHRAERTANWYRDTMVQIVKEHGTVPASNLQPYHFDDCCRGTVTAVKRLFNWAVRHGYLESNPLSRLEKPPQSKRDRALSEEDYRLLLKAIKCKLFRDIVRFCWETGCRPQEMTTLEARYYDSSKRRFVLPIEKSKGKTRNRVIYLSTTAKEIAERMIVKHPNGRLFRNLKGKHWTPSNSANRFQRLRSKVGTKYSLYQMRHSFATRMLMAGKDAIIVANLMGHANTNMLASTYSHVSRDSSFMLSQLD